MDPVKEPGRWHTCRLCGLAGSLERSQHGWVHEACLLADNSEPTDYEALGYPETEECDYISPGGLDSLPGTIDLLLGSALGDISERIEKRYPRRYG